MDGGEAVVSTADMKCVCVQMDECGWSTSKGQCGEVLGSIRVC